MRGKSTQFEIKRTGFEASYMSNGLVAYYPFNGNANDESGNGNNGTVNGATLVKDRFNVSNKAYNFDGINDSIVVNHNSAIDFDKEDSYTISFWFKHNSWPASGTTTIMNKWNSGAGAYPFAIRARTTGKVTMFSYDGSVSSGITTNEVLEVGVFYLITCRYTPSELSIFVNDFEPNENSNNATASLKNTANLNIGSRTIPSYELDGQIESIRIFDRALSNEEVKGLYSELSSTGQTILENNQAAKYYFNSNLNDESGNSYNNTLQGGRTYNDIKSKNRFGIDDRSIELNGTADYLSNSINEEIRAVSFYIKPNLNNRDIIQLTASAKISLNASNQITTTGLTNVSIKISERTTNQISLNIPNFVIVEFDEITANNVQVGYSSTYFSGNIEDIRFYKKNLKTESLALFRETPTTAI